MENMQDFVIENGVLEKYKGPGGDVTIPEGVTAQCRKSIQHLYRTVLHGQPG